MIKSFVKFSEGKNKEGSSEYVETGDAVEIVDKTLAKNKLKIHRKIHGAKGKLRGSARKKRDKLEASTLGLSSKHRKRYGS